MVTSDGVKLAYDYYPVDNPKGYAVLLHMMPADRKSWRGFAGELNKAGYAALAIDLRGHGESAGGPSGYQRFSDADHQKSILDVAAAVMFVKERGAAPINTIIIGASIGANLALQYIADNTDYKTAVLLSPGLNYRGLTTEPMMAKLKPGQRVFLAASRDDGDNAKMAQRLYDLALAGVAKQLVVYKRGGHGTNMFGVAETPALSDTIINFIKE